METITITVPHKKTDVEINPHSTVSLRYLFMTFFKIGLVSFGGHMALIAVIQRVMVDKDRTIENDTIMESIGVASILPGPLAVNVVGQAGYHLRKSWGAVISTLAIILPAFLFMMVLTWLYFNDRQSVFNTAAMAYVGCAVSAIILATGWQLFNKEIGGSFRKRFVFAISLGILLLTGNYFTTVLLLIGGALAGAFFDLQSGKTSSLKAGAAESPEADKTKSGIGTFNKIALFLLFLNQVFFYANTTKTMDAGILKLVLVFAGISLSLFGGGYVMIPIMESLFVNELQWVSGKEFIDAIAFSQATPGPILISATFIGYKVAGLAGAVLATIAIFGPSVFLVILVSRYLGRFRHNGLMINSLAGIKAVVVALILVSALRLLNNDSLNLFTAFIFVTCFLLNYRFRVSPVYIILGTVLIGLIKNQW